MCGATIPAGPGKGTSKMQVPFLVREKALGRGPPAQSRFARQAHEPEASGVYSVRTVGRRKVGPTGVRLLLLAHGLGNHQHL
jgi:hypothetical protein